MKDSLTRLCVNNSENRPANLGKEKQRGKSKTPDTCTWPPKMKRGGGLYKEPERPKTANLEKPTVLDPDLVDKLDMSLLSKELLVDSITRHRLSKAMSGGTSSIPTSSRYRPNVTEHQRQHQQQRSPSTNGEATAWCTGGPYPISHKRRSFEQILDTKILDPRFGHVDVTVLSPRMQKHACIGGQDAATARKSLDNRKLDDNNNRNGTSKVLSLSTLRKKNSRPTIQSDLEVFTSTSKSAPEPCKSCGKPDQPERLHSHPKSSQPKAKDSPTKAKSTVPKTVQKPVALNFRSDKNKDKPESTESKSDLGPQELPSPPVRPSSAPTKKGPRTITCYICGREFGTASFPIHEPRCMQKWERENNSLPASQRRPTPQRPGVSIDHSDWNTAAWEESQAQLIPCLKCRRTFLPERLLVHQRNCNAPIKNAEPDKIERPVPVKSASTPRMGPPMIVCQSCGKSFGSKSIKIHEPQCIKRMQAELARQVTAHPRKRDAAHVHHSKPETQNTILQENLSSPTGETAQKKTITCHVCGRDFGSNSIAIHRPQCLKKFHAENGKLPPSRRRIGSEDQEIMFTRDEESGDMIMDINAMAEASWERHLNQLVPCKRCGRTFNPDRVNVHERSCKGSR